MKRQLAVVVVALAALYAVVWGWWYLTADRSAYVVVFSNGTASGNYNRIPLQNIFPDPGFDSPLPTQALLAGLAVLGSLTVLAIASRLRARARPSGPPVGLADMGREQEQRVGTVMLLIAVLVLVVVGLAFLALQWMLTNAYGP